MVKARCTRRMETNERRAMGTKHGESRQLSSIEEDDALRNTGKIGEEGRK